MNMKLCAGACMLVCCAGTEFAAGQLILTSDQRAITVEAAGSTQFAFPSPSYSAFSRDLTKDIPSGGGNGKARGMQNSTVSASAFSATGLGSAESNAGPANCIFSQATSDFRILFKVNGAVGYAASGSVDGAQFRLAEPIAGAIQLVQAPVGTPTPFAVSGTLRPGRVYTMLAQASQLTNACNGNSVALAGSYTLDATFTTLPDCPGDLNYDRLVDDSDFSIFAVAYDALLCPDPPALCEADLNHDTLVDDADFSIFAVAYDALLCPE